MVVDLQLLSLVVDLKVLLSLGVVLLWLLSLVVVLLSLLSLVVVLLWLISLVVALVHFLLAVGLSLSQAVEVLYPFHLLLIFLDFLALL